jgi:hypothetical protein
LTAAAICPRPTRGCALRPRLMLMPLERRHMTIQDDVTRRSADIHWPDGLAPTDADLFAHNEIVIQAASHQIWQHLIAATAWPRWYSNSAEVIVNDPSELLGAGVSFDWTTFDFRSPAPWRSSCRRSASAGTETAKACAHTPPG